MAEIVPSVKIKTKGDISGINEKFNEWDKITNSVHLPHLKEKTCRRCSSLRFSGFRERMSSFSLDLRPFGPSVLKGARSKVDLRG